MKPRIALIGDYSAKVIAHQAIPRALELAVAAERCDVTWEWVSTATIKKAERDLSNFAGVWMVPATPYASAQGAFDAIRWAREAKRPLLGSCGGFQHMVMEFARNVVGLTEADTEETNPTGQQLVVTGLSCALLEESGSIRFATGSRIRACYGRDRSTEGYHCRFGLNSVYRARLERAGLWFTAFDEDGEIRAAELPERDHPFYVGTLFQSERAALREEVPPLAQALVRAVA